MQTFNLHHADLLFLFTSILEGFQKLSKMSLTRNRQSGDEALDLPARSRFGEGRAETFHCSASGLQAHEKKPISQKADAP